MSMNSPVRVLRLGESSRGSPNTPRHSVLDSPRTPHSQAPTYSPHNHTPADDGRHSSAQHRTPRRTARDLMPEFVEPRSRSPEKRRSIVSTPQWRETEESPQLRHEPPQSHPRGRRRRPSRRTENPNEYSYSSGSPEFVYFAVPKDEATSFVLDPYPYMASVPRNIDSPRAHESTTRTLESSRPFDTTRAYDSPRGYDSPRIYDSPRLERSGSLREPRSSALREPRSSGLREQRTVTIREPHEKSRSKSPDRRQRGNGRQKQNADLAMAVSMMENQLTVLENFVETLRSRQDEQHEDMTKNVEAIDRRLLRANVLAEIEATRNTEEPKRKLSKKEQSASDDDERRKPAAKVQAPSSSSSKDMDRLAQQLIARANARVKERERGNAPDDTPEQDEDEQAEEYAERERATPKKKRCDDSRDSDAYAAVPGRKGALSDDYVPDEPPAEPPAKRTARAAATEKRRSRKPKAEASDESPVTPKRRALTSKVATGKRGATRKVGSLKENDAGDGTPAPRRKSMTSKVPSRKGKDRLSAGKDSGRDDSTPYGGGSSRNELPPRKTPTSGKRRSMMEPAGRAESAQDDSTPYGGSSRNERGTKKTPTSGKRRSMMPLATPKADSGQDESTPYAPYGGSSRNEVAAKKPTTTGKRRSMGQAATAKQTTAKAATSKVATGKLATNKAVTGKLATAKVATGKKLSIGKKSPGGGGAKPASPESSSSSSSVPAPVTKKPASVKRRHRAPATPAMPPAPLADSANTDSRSRSERRMTWADERKEGELATDLSLEQRRKSTVGGAPSAKKSSLKRRVAREPSPKPPPLPKAEASSEVPSEALQSGDMPEVVTKRRRKRRSRKPTEPEGTVADPQPSTQETLTDTPSTRDFIAEARAEKLIRTNDIFRRDDDYNIATFSPSTGYYVASGNGGPSSESAEAAYIKARRKRQSLPASSRKSKSPTPNGGWMGEWLEKDKWRKDKGRVSSSSRKNSRKTSSKKGSRKRSRSPPAAKANMWSNDGYIVATPITRRSRSLSRSPRPAHKKTTNKTAKRHSSKRSSASRRRRTIGGTSSIGRRSQDSGGSLRRSGSRHSSKKRSSKKRSSKKSSSKKGSRKSSSKKRSSKTSSGKRRSTGKRSASPRKGSVKRGSTKSRSPLAARAADVWYSSYSYSM